MCPQAVRQIRKAFFFNNLQVFSKTQFALHAKAELDQIAGLKLHVLTKIGLFTGYIGKLSLILAPDDRLAVIQITPQNYSKHPPAPLLLTS
jgi:hypothetical protein